MNETGTIKFHCTASGRELGAFPGFPELNAARQQWRRLGLLGVGADGVGFGNVSRREGTGFYITGSGTGGLSSLGPADYARVIEWDFERNWLRSEGCVLPSAESLTHAAIYAAAPEVKVVLHGHDRIRWRQLCADAPATGPDVPYGTPAMAREVERLFRETEVARRRVFAMAGHEDGLVVFDRDFAEALATLTALGP